MGWWPNPSDQPGRERAREARRERLGERLGVREGLALSTRVLVAGVTSATTVIHVLLKTGTPVPSLGEGIPFNGVENSIFPRFP